MHSILREFQLDSQNIIPNLIAGNLRSTLFGEDAGLVRVGGGSKSIKSAYLKYPCDEKAERDFMLAMLAQDIRTFLEQTQLYWLSVDEQEA